MLTKNDLIEALQPIHEKLDNLDAGQKRLENRQMRLEDRQMSLESAFNQSSKDNADFFHQTWAYIDEIKKMLETRIKKVEDHIWRS